MMMFERPPEPGCEGGAVPDEYDPQADLDVLLASAFNLKDVAERLAISPRQVQAHIDDGSLVAVNVGRGGQRRDLRVLEEDLEGFLRRRRTGAQAAPSFPRSRSSGHARSPNPGYAERRAHRLDGTKR